MSSSQPAHHNDIARADDDFRPDAASGKNGKDSNPSESDIQASQESRSSDPNHHSAVGHDHPTQSTLISSSLSDELRQKRYALFAAIILIAIAVQIWILF